MYVVIRRTTWRSSTDLAARLPMGGERGTTTTCTALGGRIASGQLGNRHVPPTHSANSQDVQ
jgi:hypothetical protein